MMMLNKGPKHSLVMIMIRRREEGSLNLLFWDIIIRNSAIANIAAYTNHLALLGKGIESFFFIRCFKLWFMLICTQLY